jgi:four helix bundle protein
MSIENSIAYDKAYKFSIRIVETYKYLKDIKKETVLSKQLLKSGTSIAANIAEANGAISSADFSAKISISYKESLETQYWISLLKDTKYLDNDDFESLDQDILEIIKILYSILKTTRKIK